MKTAYINKSLSDEWGTPHDLFKKACAYFDVFPSLDVSATKEHTKCSKYFTKYDDALSKDWNSQAFYMNPPFSQAGKWIEYAYNQHRKHKIDGLLLLAVRTDTIAWQTFILGIGHIHQNIWFLKGRVHYLDESGTPSKNPSPFPSAFVYWKYKP